MAPSSFHTLAAAACVLLVLASAQAAADCAAGAEACGRGAAAEDSPSRGGEGDQSSLLQSRRGIVDGPEEHPEPGAGPPKKRWPNPDDFCSSAEDGLADTTLLDLALKVAHGRISKESWMEAFDELDKNNNGYINTWELCQREFVVPPRHANMTKHKFNLTKADIKAGVSLFVAWYPHHEGKVLARYNLLVHHAYHGTLPGHEGPKQGDPIEGMYPTLCPWRKQAPGLLAVNRTQRSVACVTAVIQVVTGTIGLLFSIIGIDLPSGSKIAELITGNGAAIDQIVQLSGALNEPSSAWDAAGAVWDIFNALHDNGIFSEVVHESLAEMNWWGYAVSGVQVAAIIASWLGTGFTAFAAEVALVVFGAEDLLEGAVQVHTNC